MKNILFSAMLSVCMIFSIAHSSKAQQRPNIVVLFVDDLGWADLGYRNSLFETPNIDQLSEDGLDFERAYIASPSCSPSRASILTGKEPVRIGMVRHIIEEDNKMAYLKEGYNMWRKDPVQMHQLIICHWRKLPMPKG